MLVINLPLAGGSINGCTPKLSIGTWSVMNLPLILGSVAWNWEVNVSIASNIRWFRCASLRWSPTFTDHLIRECLPTFSNSTSGSFEIKGAPGDWLHKACFVTSLAQVAGILTKKTHQHMATNTCPVTMMSPWCHHPGSIRLSCRSGSDHSLEGLTEYGEFLTACPKSYKSYMKMKMWNHVNMILSQRPDDRFYPSSSLLIPPDMFRWHLSDIDSRLADWKHTWPS